MDTYTLRCDNCGSERVRLIDGEYICIDCGTVLGIQYIPVFHDDNNIERSRFIVYRISRSKHRRSKSTILTYQHMIDMICQGLNIPDKIRIDARRILASMLKKRKGRVRRTYMTFAAIYLAILKHSYPLDIKDILKVLGKLGYNLGRRKLIYILEEAKNLGLRYKKVTTIEQELMTIIHRLIIHKEVLEKIRKIYSDVFVYQTKLFNQALDTYRTADKRWIVGKGKRTIAACLVYIAELILSLNEKRRTFFSQRILSQITNLSEYTIRERVIDYYKIHDATNLSIRKRKRE